MVLPLIVALIVLLIVGLALWRALHPRSVAPKQGDVDVVPAPQEKSAISRMPVGKAPMAPRLPRPVRPADPHAALVKSYQAVLAKRGKPAKRGTPRSKMSVAQAIQLVVETDQFTMLGGRSVNDLPASKAKIEDALKFMIGKTEDGKTRNQLSRSLLDLAKYQDLEACKAGGRNPYDLYQRELSRLQGELEKLLESLPFAAGKSRAKKASRKRKVASEAE